MLSRFILFGGTFCPDIMSDLKKLVILNNSRSFFYRFCDEFSQKWTPAKTERVREKFQI